MLFRKLLEATFRDGALRLIDLDGSEHLLGDGSEPVCTVKLNRPPNSAKMVANPVIGIAESYMNDEWDIAPEEFRSFMELAARNFLHLERHPLTQAANTVLRQGRRLKQYNPVGKAQANVAHHYDLSSALYDLFLDSDRQYSCAYFLSPEDDIETAQEQKKRHIAAKLYLNKPGLKVLDIGSGWGGLGLSLARAVDCDLTGVTLSREQHALSTQRVKDAGLEERVRFNLQDYREVEGTFDRLVSVGMFEHVGKKNYAEFFAKTYDLLAEDGVFLLHTIGRINEPGPINAFIRKYIFPGADVPTLSELTPVIEDSGFYMTDIEILRLHYAETLRLWHEAFIANREKVKALYDERFCRMWELYLVGCEMGFRHQGLTVFQVQMTKRQDALPLTRDYIYEWEREQAPARRKQSAAE
jgi:cyclopropane-fatty-acyl-phospholipid synthase